MNLYEHSGIARPVDFSYPTNKLIAILSAVALLVGVAMGWWQGLVFGKVLLLGLQFAATVFLTWAFAREVDPHEPYSAFGAVALVATAFVWGLRPDLLSVAIVMGAARVLICSCGRQVTLIDKALVAGGAVWLALGQHQALAAIVVAMAFLLDGLLKPANRWSLLFGVLTLGVAVFSIFQNPPIPTISSSLVDSKLLVLGLFIVFMFIAYRRPEAPADSNSLSIGRRRLLALQILLLLWALFVLPIYGQGAINKLFVVWAIMAGVSTYGIALGIFKRKAGNEQ